MQKKPWIKLPTEWIRRYGLKDIKWGKEGGSSATAGLMILVALLHRVEGEDTGVARATYDALCEATGLSRTKVADGLRYLELKQFITREPSKIVYIKFAYIHSREDGQSFHAKDCTTAKR